MKIDFTDNPKQAQFVSDALCAAEGLNDYRYICYGGGIRGGKTFGMLGVFMLLCKGYPKSKWVIYRKDFPSLQDTTIPSTEKMLSGNSRWKWHKDKSNYHLEYNNGSKIFFYGENITQDPKLDSMLGLECNGIGLEQVEELSSTLFQMAQSRIGSWYIPRMPKPLILMTLNPTQEWAKQVFYEPWREGKLLAPFHFIEALPKDNPHVTQDQWDAWQRLDERYKAQYIDGDWSDFDIKDNLWAFAFRRSIHIASPDELDLPIWKGDKSHVMTLSFDFNRNPICCSVIQEKPLKLIDNGKEKEVNCVYFIETIKLAQSNIYALCDYIKVNYHGFLYRVTGDATGKASTALVKDNLNYYTVIMRELKLQPTQIQVPSVNPKIEDNQVLFNSILQNYSTANPIIFVKMHPIKSKAMIYDCGNVRTSPDGGIEKSNRSDEAQQADAIDTARYYFNRYHGNFLKLAK